MIMKHKFIQLTSPQNEQFKKWKKLKTRKGREKSRSLLVEGEHLVQEAVRAQVPIRALIIPFGAALVIFAMAGTTAASRLTGQHADCKVASCEMTVIR